MVSQDLHELIKNLESQSDSYASEADVQGLLRTDLESIKTRTQAQLSAQEDFARETLKIAASSMEQVDNNTYYMYMMNTYSYTI